MYSIRIRKAEKSDCEVIVSFIRLMLNEMSDMGGHKVNQNESFWISFRDIVLPEIENSDRVYLIAEINNGPVGFIEGKSEMLYEVYEHRKSFHIRSVYVKPEKRNKGIATDLIRTALSCAIEQGCQEADLNILSNNQNAKRVYDKFGFKVFQHEMRVPLPTNR